MNLHDVAVIDDRIIPEKGEKGVEENGCCSSDGSDSESFDPVVANIPHPLITQFLF
jgi:hypothetical protein